MRVYGESATTAASNETVDLMPIPPASANSHNTHTHTCTHTHGYDEVLLSRGAQELLRQAEQKAG